MSHLPQALTNVQRYRRLSMHPLTVLACVILGGFIGYAAPAIAKNLTVVGTVYVDLLKMIVMPFMMSAIIFSLQNLSHDGDASRMLGRVLLVFVSFSISVAVLSAVLFRVASPGDHLSESVKSALGTIVGTNSESVNLDMFRWKADETPTQATVTDLLTSLIPTNIFAALANDDTIKALIFALLFGFAVGQVPSHISGGLNQTLETIYKACQTLTQWMNFPLPIVLICLSASQIANTGFEPLRAMSGFVITFLGTSAVLLGLAVVVIRSRSSITLNEAVRSMRVPFALSVATNNSATCMAVMIAALSDNLRFSKSRVELLVPLSVSLLKVGAVAYFVCATLFVADLYGRELAAVDVGQVILISFLAGFASSGMVGIVSISLVGTICKYLNLPFEAAFILFVAVDPICAMARTSVTVVAACAAVAIICPKPHTLDGVADPVLKIS
jgi:Na+/H+-dicarboxylate symporter